MNTKTEVWKQCNIFTGGVRVYVDIETVAAHAFITSKLDNRNALLGDAPKYLINKLLLVQNES